MIDWLWDRLLDFDRSDASLRGREVVVEVVERLWEGREDGKPKEREPGVDEEQREARSV